MEIPRIQRAAASVRAASGPELSAGKRVYRPVSKGADRVGDAVCYLLRLLPLLPVLMCSFVSFVAGSFAAVLLVASLLDPDLFLHFEITPHRTVLFYLGIFGGILAVSRGLIP